MESQKPPNTCSLHNEKLVAFCDEDIKALCLSCIDICKAKCHKVYFNMSIVKKEKEDLIISTRLLESISGKTRAMEEAVEELSSAFMKSFESNKLLMKQFFEAVITKTQTYERSLNDYYEKYFQEQTNKLSSHLENLKLSSDDLNTFLGRLNAAQSLEDDEIIQSGPELQAKMKELAEKFTNMTSPIENLLPALDEFDSDRALEYLFSSIQTRKPENPSSAYISFGGYLNLSDEPSWAREGDIDAAPFSKRSNTNQIELDLFNSIKEGELSLYDDYNQIMSEFSRKIDTIFSEIKIERGENVSSQTNSVLKLKDSLLASKQAVLMEHELLSPASNSIQPISSTPTKPLTSKRITDFNENRGFKQTAFEKNFNDFNDESYANTGNLGFERSRDRSSSPSSYNNNDRGNFSRRTPLEDEKQFLKSRIGADYFESSLYKEKTRPQPYAAKAAFPDREKKVEYNINAIDAHYNAENKAKQRSMNDEAFDILKPSFRHDNNSLLGPFGSSRNLLGAASAKKNPPSNVDNDDDLRRPKKNNFELGKLLIFGGEEAGGAFSEYFVKNKHFNNQPPLRAISKPPSGLSDFCSVVTSSTTVLLIGGVIGGKLSNRIFRYDLLKDKWSEIELTLTRPKKNSKALLSSSNTLYIIGGIDRNNKVLNEVEEIDLKIYMTVNVYFLKVTRYDFSVCKDFQGHIVVIGGMGFDANRGINTALDVCEKIDPKNSKIQEFAPLLAPRAGSASFGINKFMFVIGGYSSVGVVQTVEKFNFETDRWEMMSSLRRARAYPEIVAYSENDFIVLGGQNEWKLKSVEIWNGYRFEDGGNMIECRSKFSATMVDETGNFIFASDI